MISGYQVPPKVEQITNRSMRTKEASRLSD